MKGAASRPAVRFALAGLISLALIASADGAEKRAVVLPAQVQGPFAGRKTLPQEITLRMIEGLRNAGYVVLGPELLNLSETKCRDEACMRTMASTLGVDVIARGLLDNRTPDGPPDTPTMIRTTVESYRARPSARHRVGQRNCNGCSTGDVLDGLVEILKDHLREDAVTTTNPAALVVTKAPTSIVRKRPRWWQPLFFTTGAVGAAGAVASAVALGIKVAQNNDLDCSASFPTDRACPYRRDTTNAIITSSTMLGVSVALSVTSFVLATRRK